VTKPAYLVKGDDPTLLAEAVRTLVAELVGDEDHTLVVEDVDCAEVGVAAVLDACLTPPFLTAKRVVVGRNAGALTADDGERLVTYLDEPLDTTTLVLVGGGGTVPQKLTAALKKVGETRDAGVPGGGKARTGWLVDRLHQAPVKFDAAAGSLLGEHLGEDLGRLPGIVTSLAAAYGEGARIGVEELEPFLGEAGGVAPWDLTDAIDRGDTAGALDALHRMLAAGDRHPLVIMATLHRHYTAMLRLDGSGVRNEQEAATLLGLKSAFPAKKALNQSRKLGSQGIRRAVSLVAEADVDLRGAKAWPDHLILEVLVARLSKLAPSAAGRAGAGRR
jgi:DNA polymerase III subunit delta